MSDLPPPDRNPLGALPAAWILGIGLLGTGVVVGRRLLLPAFGLPSAWYVLPVVAPYLLLGVAAILARRDRFVLVASVACLGLGCVAALLAAGAFGLNQAWQRGISGVGGSGSGEEASGWLVVALLQGGLALLADRLLARSTKADERIILYLMSAAVLFVLVKGAMDDIADRRRRCRSHHRRRSRSTRRCRATSTRSRRRCCGSMALPSATGSGIAMRVIPHRWRTSPATRRWGISRRRRRSRPCSRPASGRAIASSIGRCQAATERSRHTSSCGRCRRRYGLGDLHPRRGALARPSPWRGPAADGAGPGRHPDSADEHDARGHRWGRWREVAPPPARGHL